MTEWTSWFNIDHPGGNGDYERLEAIRFYYRERVCARPMAMEARTTDWVAASDTGEVVHSSLEKGFWCINKEQPNGRVCSNYHVRFQCPSGSCPGHNADIHPSSGSDDPSPVSTFSTELLDGLEPMGRLFRHGVRRRRHPGPQQEVRELPAPPSAAGARLPGTPVREEGVFHPSLHR